jgi:hypothetical protein
MDIIHISLGLYHQGCSSYCRSISTFDSQTVLLSWSNCTNPLLSMVVRLVPMAEHSQYAMSDPMATSESTRILMMRKRAKQKFSSIRREFNFFSNGLFWRFCKICEDLSKTKFFSKSCYLIKESKLNQSFHSLDDRCIQKFKISISSMNSQ